VAALQPLINKRLQMTLETRVSIFEAEQLVKKAFLKHGVTENVAASVSTALVAAEAEGQVGHGFSRVKDYVAQIKSKKINVGAKVKIEHPKPTSISIDADYGFAYPALDQAISEGVLTAKEYGSAIVSIFNSHHCGALSVQVEKIANQGLIGVMMANTPKAIAPWGGKDPFFGTNPIAFAVPRITNDPLVIDLSLSKVARGKIMHAKKVNTKIPEGWALDSSGKPTTDPDQALKGSMLPIGEAKGSALALMVEILAATLSGGRPSNEASSFLDTDGDPPGVGQFLMFIDPGKDNGSFYNRLEKLLINIEEIDGVRLPGNRRKNDIQESKDLGLLVPSNFIDS
jgi:(2R)-3-sulfolactate dehydrogenase (NADP+)